MARMEFLKQNQIGTSTSIVPDSGSDVSANLIDRTTSKFWESVGASGTSINLSIEFDGPTVVSHVLLQSHNLKGFSVYYNSTTASSLFSTTTNSATSSYISFSSTTVSSIQIQMDSPITASEEYKIGEMIVTERLVQFTRNPSAKDYKPFRPKKRIKHAMPDGGMKIFEVAQKFNAQLKWQFITTAFQSSLLTAYELGEPLTFVPFPTTTAWDGFAKQVVWVNDWDFRHGTNDTTQGFNGQIKIQETPAG